MWELGRDTVMYCSLPNIVYALLFPCMARATFFIGPVVMRPFEAAKL